MHGDDQHQNGLDVSSTETSLHKHDHLLDALDHDATDPAMCESESEPLSADEDENPHAAAEPYDPDANGHEDCPTPMSHEVKAACGDLSLAAGVDLSDLES